MQITADEGYAFPQDPRDVSIVVNGLPIWRYPNYTPESITTPAPNKLDIWLTFDASFQYEVVFATIGHGLSPISQLLTLDEKATEPMAPTEEGLAFDGWYTDQAYTKLYDFSTPINDDVVLFAKWKEIKKGDLTGEGSINRKDLAMLSKYLRNPEAYPLSENALWAANINKDSGVNRKDLAILSKFLRNPELYPLP
jgi:uncharacterized repeat protein (TIGR02543 family)